MSEAVSVKNLNKSFGETIALNDISFSINKNQLFGFIGPDGAGKTTLFRILATLILPDTGSSEILGFDCVEDYKKLRQITGYMPGKFSLYQDLSVEENLTFFASIFGTTIKENYYLIEDIYKMLEPFKNRRAGKLSGGMKQKLALCCSLIHKPKILILDEPTTGVDAVSRSEFWDNLRKLNEMDITVIVSTPYMDEADLCDEIALIKHGKILKTDTPDKISRGFKKELFRINAKDKSLLMKSVKEFSNTETAYTFGDGIHYTDKKLNPDIELLKNFLEKSGNYDLIIDKIEPGIEDTFLELSGND